MAEINWKSLGFRTEQEYIDYLSKTKTIKTDVKVLEEKLVAEKILKDIEETSLSDNKDLFESLSFELSERPWSFIFHAVNAACVVF